MRRVMTIGLAALTIGLMGCTASIGEPEGSSNIGTADTMQGFLVDESTATTLRGRLGTADGQLSFSTIAQDEATTLVSVRINGKTFDVTLDNGLVVNDGHGAVLTAADRALLGALLEELAVRFAEPASHVHSLMVNATYLSEAPQDFVHTRYVSGERNIAAFTGETPTSTTLLEGDDRVRCITKGATVTAVYDLANGARYAEAVLVGANWGTSVKGAGDYSCMGKCGAGCGLFTKKYTKDCLDHDVCSHNVGATGGGANPDCGDEYRAASDDYNGACTY
jgi:hypothetical protein